MRVTDPDGRTWRVGRRWLPWRRRIRELPDTPLGLDVPDADDPVSGAIGLILFAVALVVLLPALLVIIGLVLELVLLLALVPVVVAVRIALGRPWTVQVVGPGGTVRHAERVVGWRASGERVRGLAASVRTGEQGVSPG